MVLNGTFVIIVIAVVMLWLILLSIVVYRMVGHYNALAGTTGRTTLKEILEHILEAQRSVQKHSKETDAEIEAIRTDIGFHIQQIGLVRFNPFSDTGGSQSFTIALLDGHGSGVVMTSLYARTGNRWYIKEVRAGKGVEVELSKEERMAIAKAKHIRDVKV